MYDINGVFKRFDTLLGERLSKKIVTTEDSIRYLFFYCLSVVGEINPNEVVLEYPYSSIPRAKLDTLILPDSTRDGIAFEFKYDRKNLSGRNKPRSMQAGAVFNDIYRLYMFNAVDSDKYLVYVTDDEMNRYYNNWKNGVDNFYRLKMGEKLVLNQSFIDQKSKTFQEKAGEYADPVTVEKAYDGKGIGFWLKIYRVL
jgi:hypothetical protein